MHAFGHTFEEEGGVFEVSTNDYVKFMAERLIKRMETPKSERREMKKERKEMKTPFLVRWFGMVPFSIFIALKKNKRRL